jgi:dTMP kinase
VPVDVGLERTRRRKEWNRFEDTEEAAFFERVRAAYLRMAAEEPDRFRIVDGAGSVDDSDEAIRGVVAAALGLAAAE